MTYTDAQHLLCVLIKDDPIQCDGIWGPKSKAAMVKFQTKFGISADGMLTEESGKALRHAVANWYDEVDAPTEALTEDFWNHIRYWTREEFRCQCGGKYCDGFPAEPNQTLVELVDDLRYKGGAPGHRSSGLRCRQHNANQPGAAANSKHLYGKALDFFVEGLSGQQLLALAKNDPRTNYTYIIGDGPYVHVDVK